MTRIRDSNTMKLIERRPRPDLPRWYKVTDVGTNRTYIGMEGRSEDEWWFWKEMDYLNEDKGRIDYTRKDKKNVVDAICSQFRLTKSMKEHVIQTAVELDGRKFNYTGGLRALAIGTIAYFINQRRQAQPDFEYENRIENDEGFRQFAEKLDVDMYEAVSAVKKAMNEDRPAIRIKKEPEVAPPADESYFADFNQKSGTCALPPAPDTVVP